MVQNSLLISFLLATLVGGAAALFCRKGWQAFVVAMVVTSLLCVVLGPTAAHYAEQLSIRYDPAYKMGMMSPVPGAIFISLIAGPIAGAYAGLVAAPIVSWRSKNRQESTPPKRG